MQQLKGTAAFNMGKAAKAKKTNRAKAANAAGPAGDLATAQELAMLEHLCMRGDGAAALSAEHPAKIEQMSSVLHAMVKDKAKANRGKMELDGEYVDIEVATERLMATNNVTEDRREEFTSFVRTLQQRQYQSKVNQGKYPTIGQLNESNVQSAQKQKEELRAVEKRVRRGAQLNIDEQNRAAALKQAVNRELVPGQGVPNEIKDALQAALDDIQEEDRVAGRRTIEGGAVREQATLNRVV